MKWSAFDLIEHTLLYLPSFDLHLTGMGEVDIATRQIH